MALASIGGGGFLYPGEILSGIRGDFHGGSMTLDAAGEKYAVIFQVPRTGTIDRVTFTTRSVTTPQTLRAGLETVDATTGMPTGTQYGSSAVGTQASPAADTQYEVTLGTAASATQGDIVALVVQFDSTAGNLTIAYVDFVGGSGENGIPYLCQYTASWAKLTYGVPVGGIRYDDGVYDPTGLSPAGVRVDQWVGNASTPDEYGNYFVAPVPMRAIGILLRSYMASAPFDLVLYEGSTAVATVSHDGDTASGANTANARYLFSSPVTLAKDTAYRIAIKPGATNIWIRDVPVLDNAMLNAWPGGTGMYKTTRTDAGSWTEDTTNRIYGLHLIVDQIDDGAGGGGGVGPRILTPVGGGGAYL